MKVKNKIISKLLISFISCFIAVSLIIPNKIKAEDYNPVCDLMLKKQNVFLDPAIFNDLVSGDFIGLFQDIYNRTISYQTWKDTSSACAVDPSADISGGHGGKLPKSWQQVQIDVQNDLNNGSNYNYYTNSNYNSTNNYSVTNSTTNNISYTYNNESYNYYYDVNNSYYDIENNTYNYYLSTNNYLTTVNNYNNTTIIDNGSTRVLYYRLPDGSNSLNLTEEQAINGYKTSLSVKSYENTYDSNDLVALYHFDGNELDSAYPTSTELTFDRNSIQYISSTTPFNESLALYGDSSLSVNKSGKFTSFRFNPIFNQHWSISINGSQLGSSDLNFETFTQYDEFNNKYYLSSDAFNELLYNEDLNVYYPSNFLASGSSPTIITSFGSTTETSSNYRYLYLNNPYTSPYDYFEYLDNDNYVYEYDENTIHRVSFSYVKAVSQIDSINWDPNAYYQFAEQLTNGYYYYAFSEYDYNLLYDYLAVKPDDKSVVQYSGSFNGQYLRLNNFSIDVYYGYRYPLSSISTNRSYNYVNQFYIDSSGMNQLVNFNMWNYLTINIDGSVYINGNDSGVVVDNTEDLTISFDGDSITYIDELALFNSNHNNYAPFYPYSSNIVYSVPEYYEYLSLPGIKLNNKYIDDSSKIIYTNLSNTNDISFVYNAITDWNYYLIFSNLDSNHKYYISFECSDNSNIDDIALAYVDNGWHMVHYFNLTEKNSYILEPIINNYRFRFYPQNNLSSDITYSIKLNNFKFIDLTLMFGSGYEPSEEWCDLNLNDYIDFNVNPDVTESPYNIETGYEYLKRIQTGLAKNNEILIQSIIPVNNWKIGGYRPSSPEYGDVYLNVDDLGYITSVQQFNNLDWVEVVAGLYNENLVQWISALGFNIFKYNWDYTDYKYLNDSGSNNMLVRFLSDRFRDTDNILTDILKAVGLIDPNIQVNQELNNNYNVVENYNVNPYDELNNRFNDINELNQQIDLQAPEYNINQNVLDQAKELKQIPEAIIDGYVDSGLGYLIFIPLLILIVRLIL